MEKGIGFIREKHIGRVVLTRPEALNALTLSMIKAFHKQLLAWKKDPSVLAVIIEAAECRAFCAGGDVRWLYDMGKKQDPAQLDFFWHEYQLNALIGSFPKPYISIMNGITMGGGVGIGLHGSHPIATERFIMAMPETAIGLFPDVGASFLLSRLPGGLGMYLALTGRRMQPADALSSGLVKYVIPEVSIEDVLKNIIELEPSEFFSQALDSCFNLVKLAPGALPVMPQAELECIERCFTQTSVEAILAQLKNDPHPLATETLTLMQQLSPLSLKVTFKQMQQASQLSLKDCLAMDEVLVKHFMQGSDFYEGVRALLIDKDKMPKWDPATLAEVTEEQVEAYFNVTM
jgi:enoyl-CoA hydratase